MRERNGPEQDRAGEVAVARAPDHLASRKRHELARHQGEAARRVLSVGLGDIEHGTSPGCRLREGVDDLGVRPHRDIDHAAEASAGLLRDLQAELVQREGVVLRIEHPVRKPPGFDVSVGVGIAGIEVPAHVEAGSIEHLRERGSPGGLGQRHRGSRERGGDC